MGVRTTISLRAALERFMREVLPSRRSYKKEWTRLNAIKVKRPSNPPPRVRRISDDEVRLIQSALGNCGHTYHDEGFGRFDVHDLHFHDTRYEAVTRLSKKLEVLELARVIGHNDIKSLMIYYNATIDELADKLAG